MAVSSISNLTTGSLPAAVAQVEPTGQRNGPAATAPRGQESAVTSISLAGRTRLALEQIQSAADQVKSLNETSSPSAIAAAVKNVVQSVNNLSTVANESSARNATSDNGNARASEAFRAVGSSLSNAASLLQSLGISQNESTFSVNERRLQADFRQNTENTVAQVNDLADRVGQAADQQLQKVTAPPAPVQPAPAAAAPATQNASQTNASDQETRRQDDARAQQSESFRSQLAAQLANAGGYNARTAVTTYFSVATI